LRKKDRQYTTLKDFFERFFGVEGSPPYIKARYNFIRSMAGYSIVCYLLNLKDRHNGNILIDAKGHVIHIDYGFLLGKTPGGNINFEKAPFKLTAESIELMDGTHSTSFMRFR
jgi:phosphatidylinositol kinase/protein kinase (PI-3  family)